MADIVDPDLHCLPRPVFPKTEGHYSIQVGCPSAENYSVPSLIWPVTVLWAILPSVKYSIMYLGSVYKPAYKPLF